MTTTYYIDMTYNHIIHYFGAVSNPLNIESVANRKNAPSAYDNIYFSIVQKMTDHPPSQMIFYFRFVLGE